MSWFPPGWFPGGSGGVAPAQFPTVSRDDLLRRIKLRLSRRVGTEYDDSIIDELTNAQQNILEMGAILPQFLLVTDQVDLTDAHTGVVITDTTRIFLRPNILWYKDTSIATGFDGVKVPRFDDLEQLNQLHPGEAEVPKGYFWDGSEQNPLQFRPYVTGSLSYYLNYYGRDTYTPNNPDVNLETLWTRFAGELLMHTAGQEISQFLRDEVAQNYFSQKRQEAYLRFVKQRTAVEMADTDLAMGD